jgi:hypothetical protein
MSENLIERLSRFTPDGTGLDRNALLFAAGRASVRPKRGWMALAGILAASQALTLVLLWPGPGEPSGQPLIVKVTPPDPAPFVEPSPVPAPEPSNLWTLGNRILMTEGDLPAPEPIPDLIPSGKPWKVSDFPPDLLLN